MGSNNKIPFNPTVIKDGRIVSIKADLGPYKRNSKKAK